MHLDKISIINLKLWSNCLGNWIKVKGALLNKNSDTLFFYLRCEYIFKVVLLFQRKLGNKSHNLTCCSSIQPIVINNFSEIRSTAPVLFWDYVTNCWWLRGMVYIFSIRKGKYDWFLLEWLLLDWLIFLLYLLQSVCCSKYSPKTTSFSNLNLFFHFLHPFVLKHFTIFITVMRSKFYCIVKFSMRGTVVVLSILGQWSSEPSTGVWSNNKEFYCSVC